MINIGLPNIISISTMFWSNCYLTLKWNNSMVGLIESKNLSLFSSRKNIKKGAIMVIESAAESNYFVVLTV